MRMEMKKMKKKNVLLIVLVILIFVMVMFCNWKMDKHTFNGNSIKNESEYTLDFDVLNGQDFHSLNLNEEDVLDVNANIDSGKVKVEIKEVSGESIYRSSEITTSNFKVVIPTTGAYEIKVEGKNAKGKISFSKEAGKE